jgi:hypothetical protein
LRNLTERNPYGLICCNINGYLLHQCSCDRMRPAPRGYARQFERRGALWAIPWFKRHGSFVAATGIHTLLMNTVRFLRGCTTPSLKSPYGQPPQRFPRRCAVVSIERLAVLSTGIIKQVRAGVHGLIRLSSSWRILATSLRRCF